MTISTPTTMVRIPRAIIDSIRMIAEAHERSISAELRVALDGYVRSEFEDAARILQERKR